MKIWKEKHRFVIPLLVKSLVCQSSGFFFWCHQCQHIWMVMVIYQRWRCLQGAAEADSSFLTDICLASNNPSSIVVEVLGAWILPLASHEILVIFHVCWKIKIALSFLGCMYFWRVSVHRQRYLNKVTQTGAVSFRIQEMVTSLKSAASKRVQGWWFWVFFV